MAHMIEEYNGKYSFVENGKKERAWHGLGQVFDRPLTVVEALENSRADYEVELQPLVAITPEINDMIAKGEMINPDMLLDLFVENRKATMRMDKNKVLGVVSDSYGVVQNADAFKFIDTLVTGQLDSRKDTPVIETAGVLGNGERVFVTAKFPEQIRLDNSGNDMVEMYMTFTTSHDGNGAVRCLVTPVRVVCNNTLNMAMRECSGKLFLKHTSGINQRLDLTSKENVEFAFKALNLFDVYKKSLEENFNILRSKHLIEKQLNDIVAEVMMSEDSFKVYKATGSLNHEDITTRSKNLFNEAMECLHSGVGQEFGESGTGLWLVNGITTYFQNEASYRNPEMKFDSLMDGTAKLRLQRTYDLAMAC